MFSDKPFARVIWIMSGPLTQVSGKSLCFPRWLRTSIVPIVFGNFLKQSPLVLYTPSFQRPLNTGHQGRNVPFVISPWLVCSASTHTHCCYTVWFERSSSIVTWGESNTCIQFTMNVCGTRLSWAEGHLDWAQFRGTVYHGILRLYPAKAHRTYFALLGAVSTEFCGKQCHEIRPWSPVLILKNKDRLLAHHSSYFIGYVVLKIWHHASRLVLATNQPRSKLNLRETSMGILRNSRASTPDARSSG